MGTHHKIIPDDEIKYVPKEKLNELGINFRTNR